MKKNISLGLNFILIIAVIILYYFEFSGTSSKIKNIETLEQLETEPKETTELVEAKSAVGYINLDSLELKYDLYKEMLKKSESKKKRYTTEFSTKRNSLEQKVQEFQKKAATMTQFEGQLKQQELAEEEKELYQLEQQLSIKLQNEMLEMNDDMTSRIKNYVAEYNQEKGYDIIIGKAQNTSIILYNKEQIDITNPITTGLNELYNSEKTK